MVSSTTGRRRRCDGRQKEDRRTDTEGLGEWRLEQLGQEGSSVDAGVEVHLAQKSCHATSLKGISLALLEIYCRWTLQVQFFKTLGYMLLSEKYRFINTRHAAIFSV